VLASRAVVGFWPRRRARETPPPAFGLEDARVRQFAEEGWLVFDTGAPDALLDGIREDLAGLYPDPPSPDGFQGATRVQDAWKSCRRVQRLATWPAVLAQLRQLYGREPLPFQTLNFPVGTEQPAHSDTVHFNSAPPGFMCGVWVALEDVHPDSGPLAIYPGSHRLPEFSLADSGVVAEAEEPLDEYQARHYPTFEAFMRRLIEQEGLQPITVPLGKGQALVWAANLLHGGSARNDPRLTRHSQVTHYFFNGCRYYTPVLTRGTQSGWRDPEFIPRLDT
jgi:hypothetical protein